MVPGAWNLVPGAYDGNVRCLAEEGEDLREEADDHHDCCGESDRQHQRWSSPQCRGLVLRYGDRDVVHVDALHDPGVVVESDHRVDRCDHCQRHCPRALEGADDGAEHHELGEPAGERWDSGEGEEEHGQEAGGGRGVAIHPCPVGDLPDLALAAAAITTAKAPRFINAQIRR